MALPDPISDHPGYVAGLDMGRDENDTHIVLIPKDRVVRLPDIDALLSLINDGSYDEHLEAILAAGHARKRERRGVRRPYGVPVDDPVFTGRRDPSRRDLL